MINATILAKSRLLAKKAPLRIAPSWIRCFSVLHPETIAHEIHEPIDEELLPGNRLRCFHPTHPGVVLDGRFKTISKLGYGTGSTVWLAENLEFKKWKDSPNFVSIKIAALDTDASRELMFSKLITHANPSHGGLSFIRTPFDEFRLEGPEGTHLCLVYEPMRETLSEFQSLLRRERLAVPWVKLYMCCLLEALDYLHSECRLIHTDIKDDNIMVSIEDNSVLADFVDYQKNNPQPRHVRSDGRATYLSQSDLGPLRGSRLLPELADFNLSYPGPKKGFGHVSAIQSHRFRAPEVLLGCPWSYSVDIWNMGLLMWNLLENVSLFGRPAGTNGEYDAHVHLAQMVSLLGDPPEELIKLERMSRDHQLERPVTNPRGKVCKTMNEFWGGPFFHDDDTIFRSDLVVKGKTLADTVTELSGDDKDAFLDLASGMLKWLPEERMTAKQLVKHPFFDSLCRDREQNV